VETIKISLRRLIDESESYALRQGFLGTSREYENGEESSVREESIFLV